MGKVLKFYIEVNCLDHKLVAQGFKIDLRIRTGPRSPKKLVRLFEEIVWSRFVWLEHHELMPEFLSVLR